MAMQLQSMQYMGLVNCSFHDNHGTALVVNNTNSTVFRFTGTNNFIDNQVAGENDGGAIITLANTLVSFNGMTNFISNSEESNGGTIIVPNNNVLSFNGISNFINNSASVGGGASHSNVLTFNETSNFNNSADNAWGGAISALHNTTWLWWD